MTALSIDRLRSGPQTPRIVFARDFSTEALRRQSSILIGSTRSNPWVEPFRDRTIYQMESSANGSGIDVKVQNPKPG